MRKIKHIIVTRGAGFIGSHLSSRLLDEGYKVTVLDKLSTGRQENIPDQANFIKMDPGQENAYGQLKRTGCEAVFHLSGQSCPGQASFKEPLYDLRSHVMSTFWLLEWCKRKGTPRFLHTSSMSIYGDPDCLPVDEYLPQRPKTFYAAQRHRRKLI